MFKRILNIFFKKDKNKKEDNVFNCKCKPSELMLDGEYAKLLKAYAQLLGLEHEVTCEMTYFGLEVHVSLFAKTRWYESVCDVFNDKSIAYVASLSEYVNNADKYAVEDLSKKILEGTFGEGNCIKSMKGGDGYTIIDGKLEFVPRLQIFDLPRNLEELKIRLDLAGIDYTKRKVELKPQK